MRHRHAKIIRRRAMWDRDSSPHFWPWHRHGSQTHQYQRSQNLSSSESTRVRKEPQPEQSEQEQPAISFHKDFASFRRAVDRAMERDPYGTLFGRRLWSPPSTNNMSWTSFSWLIDPKEIKENRVEAVHTPAMSGTGATPTSSSTQGNPEKPEAVAANVVNDFKPPKPGVEEYEYDPISGRKVLKSSTGASSTSKPASSWTKPPPQPMPDTRRRSVFEALFSENAVDIPVKVYEPKVYGHGAKATAEKSAETKPKASLKAGFENSRKREFQSLKASILGNTMDTTAEFGGKYTVPGTEPEPPSSSKAVPESAADAPLFSGTTYENKAAEILQNRSEKSDWLKQEGFHEAGGATATKPSSSGKETPVVQRLQTSLDRHSDAAAPRPFKAPADKARAWEKKQDAAEKAEDIDLLRSSDVRASIKPQRLTKDAIQGQKSRTRDRLERAYHAREEHDDTISKPRIRAANTDNISKHVESHPDGIVARTIRSVGSWNENFKKYIRPAHQLNEPLVFKDETLSKSASIFAKHAKPLSPNAFTPSPEVQELERLSRERIAALQQANKAAAIASAVENAKVSKLAGEITQIYEATYGKIDINHRQAGQQIPDVAEPPRLHPLSTATVKEGVARSPVIESHVSNFEPKYADIVDGLKRSRKEIHEAAMHLKAMKSKNAIRADSARYEDPFSTREVMPRYRASKVEDRASVLRNNIHASIEGSNVFAEHTKTTSDATEQLSPGQNRVQSASGLDEPIFMARKSSTASTAETQFPASSEPEKPYHGPRGLDEPVFCYTKIEDPKQKMEADLEAQSERVPRTEEPVFTPSQSPVWNDEQPPPISELKKVVEEKFTAPTIILSKSGQNRLRVVRIPSFTQKADGKPIDAFSILAGLNKAVAPEFLDYFPKLQKAGYRLIAGGANSLTFEKDRPAKQAATVLDEIPTEIEAPGPSAPIAPPTTMRRASRIRRQEKVFSGTTTAPARPIGTAPEQPEASRPPPKQEYYESATSTPTDGFFSRLSRTFRRVTLTVLALAGGAYVIGFVAEGVGAQTQAQRGLELGEGGMGPRKRIVLPVDDGEKWRRGTRPGIYSTESSR